MRIFLAGGSGVIGSRLTPRLVAAGHDVTATTRRAENRTRLAAGGADAVVADVYDADRIADVVAAASPDIVLHQLTDLSEYDLRANARIRREGTANLVAAAAAAGVPRILVQSISWVFPDGDKPATEDDPITSGSAVDEMESTVRKLPHCTVLRYGLFYGPGTWYAPDGRIARDVMAGKVPATPQVSTFVHIDDAVAATVHALDWPDGTYHIVDDEPAPGTAWLPAYAASLGAPTPVIALLPEGTPKGRPVSNAKARKAGWTPAHPTWREGFTHLHARGARDGEDHAQEESAS